MNKIDLNIFKVRLRLHNSCSSGFTLIEILVAIFIFSIIVTTIFGSYSQVFSNTKALAENMTAYEMAQNCLNRVRLDLSAAYVTLYPEYKPPETNDDKDSYRFVGSIDNQGQDSFSKLRFSSTAHVCFDRTSKQGIAQIIYYTQETESSGVILRRQDVLYPYPEFAEKIDDPILCENIKTLSFKYIDMEGNEHETWDSDSDQFKYATPRAIKIFLVLGKESFTHSFETSLNFPLIREIVK